jgi:hypothetical protein
VINLLLDPGITKYGLKLKIRLLLVKRVASISKNKTFDPKFELNLATVEPGVFAISFAESTIISLKLFIRA